MQDARYVIAETYRQLAKAGESDVEFTKAINNCEGPDDALRICVETMQKLIDA